ncbi:MAG: hypothetical protein GYA55_11635 [SAR324 cluster bacterium]|uniref:Uncharacterized protein n=1 Tax=SAR324 cluster bacterium TaxID=2024889 RepID=A0A7X9IKL0_9DELT|nr:hypothetical protein [SAR324 cluster bacterium]
MEIKQLLQFASDVINDNANSSTLLERIQIYFDAFEKFRPFLENMKLDSRADLVELLEKHNKVLRITMDLREDTSRAIRELKKRGKGIMAYTDIYPKKISLGSQKKG